MKFAYTDGKFTGSFSFPATQAQSEYFNETIGAEISADAVMLDNTGIQIELAGENGKGMFQFEPNGWGKFWQPDTPELSGIGACLVWLRWMEFIGNHNADYVIQKIEAGEIGFNDIKAINEQLLHHNQVQQSLSEAVADGTITDKLKAKQSRGYNNLTPEVWELYNCASWIYISSSYETWESACYKACKDHPELIPSSWKNHDVALRKTASRYMDTHPLRHQSRDR